MSLITLLKSEEYLATKCLCKPIFVLPVRPGARSVRNNTLAFSDGRKGTSKNHAKAWPDLHEEKRLKPLCIPQWAAQILG